MPENNSRPLCPRCGKGLSWIQEDFETGRLFCIICAYSLWFYREQRKSTKEEFRKIWGAADGRHGGNNPGGQHKKLRTYYCIICQEEVTREVYSRENLCEKKECRDARQLLYAVRSHKKRGIKLRVGKMHDVLERLGRVAA